MSICNSEEDNLIEIPFDKEINNYDKKNFLEDGLIIEEKYEEISKEQSNLDSDKKNILFQDNLNESLDEEEYFKGEISNFELPQKFSNLIEKIIIIIKHQLFILDSIHRLDNYNTPIAIVWRHQINHLGITDRYLLYRRLKQLKQMINQLKQFSDCVQYFFDEYDKESIILRQTQNLIKELKNDLNRLQNYNDINFEIKNFLNLEASYCFNSSFNMVKQNNILKIILHFILKIIDFSNSKKKKLDCKFCRLKNQEINFVLEHILHDHLQFLRFLNSSLGRCLVIQCKEKRNIFTNYKNYSVKIHTLKFHSMFYKIEKPLRFIFKSQEQLYYYGNRRDNKNKKFFIDFNILKDKLPQIVTFELENYLLNIQQKKIDIYENLKNIILNNLENLNEKIQLGKLEIFDEICILIKMGWSKLQFLNGNQIHFRKLLLPEKFNFISTHNNIISLEFQEQIIDLIFYQNELISLYNRLLLGYYNNYLTQNQFDLFLKELSQFIYGIAVFNLIKNDQDNQLNSSCIFNGTLCDERFETKKQSFDHYFFGHQGIAYCLCNSTCKGINLLTLSIEQIHFHCHDFHKKNFKNFIQEYLKEQKLYYAFKAVCFLCKINIKVYSDAYWMDIDGVKNTKIQLNLDNLRWSDILYSYEQYYFVNNQVNSLLQEQYEKYINENLKVNENEIAFNDKNQVVVCKRCKQKKENKMRHINKNQFDNNNMKQIIPLARLCANISTKCEKMDKFSYPHLVGNIYAQSKKALFFFEDTDILYSINMNCAKVREKFKLMGINEFERENVIKMCLHHHFLSNHCYQMCYMSQFIIRQQQQLIVLNKQLWRRYLEQNKIQNATDKMQLEFQKLQDLILFDDIIHRNQIYFIYQNFNMENSVFMSDFIQKLEEFFQIYQIQKARSNNKIIYQFIKQFVNQDDEDQQFWKLTLWILLYCEQQNDDINNLIKDSLIDSLIEYVLDNEILTLFLRRYLLMYVQKLINNKIHPIYIGIMFQIKFQYFMKKNVNLTKNQEYIIQNIFKSLSQQTINICNLQQYQNNNDNLINYDLLLTKQHIYKLKNRWFELEMLMQLNLSQFIDMNCRIKLVKYAFDSCYKNKEVEEIIKSDMKWTIQSALQFLNCLKELKNHLPKQDRKTIKQHLHLLRPLEDEIADYQQNYFSANQSNFINKDTINNLMLDHTKLKKKYEWIKKIHIVYFIPVEVKFQNMIKVLQSAILICKFQNSQIN